MLVGGVPLGLRRTADTDANARKVVEADATERATVVRMVELRAKGSSLRQIATSLKAEARASKRPDETAAPLTCKRAEWA